MSWWVGLTPQKFDELLKVEQARMRISDQPKAVRDYFARQLNIEEAEIRGLPTERNPVAATKDSTR